MPEPGFTSFDSISPFRLLPFSSANPRFRSAGKVGIIRLYERVPSFPILFPTSDLAPLSLPPRIALACVQNNSEQGGPFLILIR